MGVRQARRRLAASSNSMSAIVFVPGSNPFVASLVCETSEGGESSSRELSDVKGDDTPENIPAGALEGLFRRRSLSQKSNTTTRSGIRYLRPLMCTSSIFIFFDISVRLSAGIISMLPLLMQFMDTMSVTGGMCLGIRRLGCCNMLDMCRTHPFFVRGWHGCQRRIKTIEMPVKGTIIARSDAFP